MEKTGKIHKESNETNLREELERYIGYWPWFLVAIFISLSISFLYLRYATPVYETIATILIKDEKNSALSELAAFQDLGLTGSLNQSGFENEIQILKSKSLTERVVKELNLNVKYISEGNVRNSELYDYNIPLNVTVLTAEDSIKFPFTPIFIKAISASKFELWSEENSSKREFFFGDKVALEDGTIMVTTNFDFVETKDKTFYDQVKVVITSIPETVADYRQKIQINQLTDMSSVLQLSLYASNTDKSEAILNELIKQYNQDAIDDRNMVSRNTANFINRRLEIISEELDSVETGKVEFKESNKLTDIVAEGQLFLQNESEYNKRLLSVETQLELVKTMMGYVREAKESDLLPTNLGIEKEGTASAISTYNQTVLERDRLLGSSTEKNPAVVNLDEQIRRLKATVLQGLNNSKISLEIQKNDLVAQEAVIDSKISSIPSKEKLFRGINRQQEIKETLYLYLLQKREENAISMAVTTPKAKVVDYAYSSMLPVSPKRLIILLAAIVLGLLIPFSIIYVRLLLDNKVHDKAFVEQKAVNTSVIGEIPKLDKKEAELVQKNDRSIFAESFRILRTNLQYLFTNISLPEGVGKTIFITSTIKGEGKTLVSYNLALTLANTGAKVILVGADIRNPQLHRYTPNAQYKKGVVEYLVHKDSKVNNYISKSEFNTNLDLLFSGTIPPNPAELWMNNRTAELFTELREIYDYVIVDTAPSMLVTDTFLINTYADATLYVMRAGYTEKKLLKFPIDNIENKKLKNVAFVLNNVKVANLGYGNKYGYYYEKELTLWEKLKSNF